ncbi:MAG: hypothetical protein HYX75_07820 [Acidobacteria bacterium]|nr:hypothetical protein [Acidobacteriota bacterium]
MIRSVFTVASLLLSVTVTSLAAGETILVSTSTAGGSGAGSSYLPYISPNGRFVCYVSEAGDIVEGDGNGKRDVFLFDVQKRTNLLVSTGVGGVAANGISESAMPSANGRWVPFSSGATNLVVGDGNGFIDAFLYDSKTKTIERVSLGEGGEEGDWITYGQGVSPSGRFVLLGSVATNLVADDTNGKRDVFLRDRKTGTTERVSLTSAGGEADADCFVFVQPMTPDARYITFYSAATNLVGGNPNPGGNSVYVRDRKAGTTTLVSLTAQGQPAIGDNKVAAISKNGRFVAFYSNAALVSEDTNGAYDAYMRDLKAGTVRRVSLGNGGVEGNGTSLLRSMSGNARFVGFVSEADNLVDGDVNGKPDAFVRDLKTGVTTRVSVATDGSEGDLDSNWPFISDNGRWISFYSEATNLITGDNNGAGDVFLRRR